MSIVIHENQQFFKIVLFKCQILVPNIERTLKYSWALALRSGVACYHATRGCEHAHWCNNVTYVAFGETVTVFQIVESLLKTKWRDDLYPRTPRPRS